MQTVLYTVLMGMLKLANVCLLAECVFYRMRAEHLRRPVL